MLANLLRGGYIAESYVPSRRVMNLRELVRYRANLIRMRSSVKNRVHIYLLMNNIRIDGSPFTKGFLDELRKVEDTRIEGYTRIIERLNLEIHEASRIICSEALSDENARLLMTIPGISFYSALLIISEIGILAGFLILLILCRMQVWCLQRIAVEEQHTMAGLRKLAVPI
jgi:transposase